MHAVAVAVLCLAAVALARPQDYKHDAVTTVTERAFTIRGDADKYYNAGYSSYPAHSGYAHGYYGAYSAAPYSYSTVASAVPLAQQNYAYHYQHAAPAVSYSAAPAVSYSAAPAVSYSAAPAVSYAAAPALSYAAAPAVSYSAAPVVHHAPAVSYAAVTPAPAVAYSAATVAPALAYPAATVAPALAYHAVTAAPAVSYQANYGLAANVGLRSSYDYDQSLVSGADTKIYKHVYAFAAPEEPAARATVRVQAPISKRKHYKLVFIKAPSQQTVVDSDITLPAQEEEKTLIYVLSKNQKQIQPEIRIKQAEASKHAKPEVFFLKYKNEAEAQAIASGAISGQNANVPPQGEIISDGSVSLLGQSSAFGSSSFGSGSAFESESAFDGAARAGSSGASNILYRSGFASGNAGLSAVSAGTVGIVPSPAVVASAPVVAAPVVAAPLVAAAPSVALVGDAASSYRFGPGAGLSSGFSAYDSRSYSTGLEPASVAVQVTTEPSDNLEATTASSLSL